MPTYKIIEGSTTEVAQVNADGRGTVILLQDLANQQAAAHARATALDAEVAAVTALGLTVPAAL